MLERGPIARSVASEERCDHLRGADPRHNRRRFARHTLTVPRGRDSLSALCVMRFVVRGASSVLDRPGAPELDVRCVAEGGRATLDVPQPQGRDGWCPSDGSRSVRGWRLNLGRRRDRRLAASRDDRCDGQLPGRRRFAEAAAVRRQPHEVPREVRGHADECGRASERQAHDPRGVGREHAERLRLHQSQGPRERRCHRKAEAAWRCRRRDRAGRRIRGPTRGARSARTRCGCLRTSTSSRTSRAAL